LPSGLATAATWNPELAFRGGAMIGAEARASGMNVHLAGGVDLVREPRNGRNFEYGGEDPLLAGTMVGAQVRGIESNRIVATVKHYALNDQETGRGILNVVIAEDQARMSDLLAFEIALETSDAGSVMCAYNKVNGAYSCENDWLLNRVLKGDWGFRGYVMSDWGATHTTLGAANGGLDQETGDKSEAQHKFGARLTQAIAAGHVPAARLDDMARRILRTLFAKGLVDQPVAPGPIDFAAHAAVTRADAAEGAVLLKNDGVLPLAASARRIAVIGSHADVGVLSGGGSAQVYPPTGNAVPGLKPTGWPGPVVYFPSSPMRALQARRRNARIRYADGADPAVAARLAADSDVAIVFVNQWTAESQDFPIVLPDNQGALVAAVAAANPRTVVVLETGGPVLAPWIGRVAAVLEAWYPGSEGGEAIADLLTGRVNPSGRLPVSFLGDETQLVRPQLDGAGLPRDTPFDVRYSEGAAVGYKWFDRQGLKPLFAFGHGLSYTRFAYTGLAAAGAGGTISVQFRVRNTGAVAGMDTPQVYVAPVAGGWEAPKRLGGWKKVELKPGGEASVSLTLDPRLLAVFDTPCHCWRIAAGDYRVMLGASSADLRQSVVVRLPARTLPASFRP
jgi:beta-glucosidase